jgi:tRNA (guanine-N7-)-methyltransferase
MSRNKLQRFEENRQSHNVLEPGKPGYEVIKGHWRKDYFKNSNPLVVELACGYGEYTVGLAREFADKNFIGVDIKGARIWKGSQMAQQEDLGNVAFLRTQIQMIDRFFNPGEIDEIWLTFPDPRPRESDVRRRLTHPNRLEEYKKIMTELGVFHLKTDSQLFFDYTLETLHQRDDVFNLKFTYDLYASEYKNDHHGITTRYEKKFLSEDEHIKYLRFQFKKYW